MKTKRLFLSLVTILVTFTAWADSAIRLHAQYPLYNTKGTVIESCIKVPSDDKTDWVSGDMIFMILDGGDADKGFNATYDGSTWSFAEWYKNGGTPDFKPEGGTVSFAMSGENLNLSTDRPSNYNPSKTSARTLTNYTGGKVGDIMSTNSGTYTVDDNGNVDIYLNFERPMAKIHIIGAYAAAPQIRNHVEGTMPGGVDNAAGTNANYNKSKTMTLNEISRYMPNTQTFRDRISGNQINGAGNMVYATRPEDAQIVDAVYYGTMEPDENGEITIVMCSNVRTYPGIQANEALGKNAVVAYWRKFPGKSINPNDDIYIYGPMSDEEAELWTPQGVTGEMNFSVTSLNMAANQQVSLKLYCKWKAPAPSDRTLTFTVSDPSVITVSEDGSTLYSHSLGTATITATTADGYQSTLTVNVKDVQELVDGTKSKWGSSLTSKHIGWMFLNNTIVDLTVKRVAMMVYDGAGGYKEVESQDGLNLLARANNGIARGTLRVKEENVPKLSTSILRITYVYNGKDYSVDVPFSSDVNIYGAKFVECYDSESTTEGWETGVAGRFTPVILNENGDCFLSVTQNERSNNSCEVMGSVLAGKANTNDDFTLTFDMRLGNSGGGTYAQSPVSVEFKDINNSGVVFSLTATGVATSLIDGTSWIINNNNERVVDLPNSGVTTSISQITWCSYQITRIKGLTFLTIKNRETGEVIFPRQLVGGVSNVGGLGDIIFTTKRYRANLALDNIVVREVIDSDIPVMNPTSYTICYRNENNEEIKPDTTIYSIVGEKVSATESQMASILFNNEKYLYESGNDAITLVKDPAANVITLVYRKARVYNYTVNATNSDGEILKTIKVSSGFEGDNLIIPYSTFIVKDEILWSTYAAYKEYREHVTLTQDNQVINITYTLTNTENVIYYAEAEDVEGVTCYSAGNSEIRSSQAAMGYAEQDVKFTTLQPGNYQLTFVLYSALLTQERSMTFTVGNYEFTHSYTGSNFSSKTFSVFTITEPTDLILKQGGDIYGGVDFVYIQRLDSTFVAEFNAADSTLIFKKGLVSDTDTTKVWDATNTGNNPGWYSYRQYISKVVFDKSFADARPQACSYWFYNHYNLKSISGMENLNTSKVTDMCAMFYYCYNLQDLDVSHFNTSEVTDMGWMFMGCSRLKSLDVSNLDTRKVTNMKSMFNNCYWLESLDVSHFNTSSVTDMSYMFNECESLTTLDVSNFNTSNVTNMTQMFCYCTNLTTIDVSNFDTSNAQSLGWMFCGCFSLEHVDVSHFKTDKANIMTSMFWNCYSLKNVDVTSFNTENVTSMGWMFVGCSSLKTLNLSSFNTNKVSEVKFMLANCSNLSTVYVGEDWNMTNVTSGDSVFVNSENLVGGMGTRYDADNIDYRYACIDGGSDAPGYFTDIKEFVIRGDVNGDGEVNVGDLVCVSNFMAGDDAVSKDAADVNQDGEVNVGDMVVISNIMSGNDE